jgi:hypothetical protein
MGKVTFYETVNRNKFRGPSLLINDPGIPLLVHFDDIPGDRIGEVQDRRTHLCKRFSH